MCTSSELRDLVKSTRGGKVPKGCAVGPPDLCNVGFPFVLQNEGVVREPQFKHKDMMVQVLPAEIED